MIMEDKVIKTRNAIKLDEQSSLCVYILHALSLRDCQSLNPPDSLKLCVARYIPDYDLDGLYPRCGYT
jgi:hypothetical protein